MSQYQEATNNFIRSSKDIIGTLDMLKTAVDGGDLSDIEFSSDRLAHAADTYMGNTTKHGYFGFDEIAAIPPTHLPRQERIASDLLVGVLLDIEVANTLIVAGQLIGETTGPASSQNLNEVRDQLDHLIGKVDAPLTGSTGSLARTARFGFDEVPEVTCTPTSADLDPGLALETAKANFEQGITKTIELLITETEQVLEITFKQLINLDDKFLNQALAQVGKTIIELPWLGKITTKGLQIALQALQKFSKLLGLQQDKTLQEYAAEILKQIKGGRALLNKFLGYSYGLENEARKQHISDLLAKTTADITQIEAGLKQLAGLQSRFMEDMAVIKRLIEGLNIGAKFVGKVLPDAVAVPLFGVFYLTAMDYVLLAGMDFADTTTLITFVEGVIELSEKVLI